MDDFRHSFINFFRQAAPYIHTHRNKTFVFCIQDNETTDQYLQSIVHDLAILHSLQIKVIIVFGARNSINQRIDKGEFYQHRRITDHDTMKSIIEVVGALKIKFEAILSMGIANSPMQGAAIETSSGNYIIARPIGIVDGKDFALTGAIRKVRDKAIKEKLEQKQIVVIPPIGYSTTGEVFNLNAEEIASEIAISLQADKLIYIDNQVETVIEKITQGRAITPDKAKQISEGSGVEHILEQAAYACENGVNRAYLLQQNINGAAIIELFTRDGVGVMVTNDNFDSIDNATIDDIPGLLEIIQPLEEKGILVRRSRELLEMEIDYFTILKRDNTVIGCAALYPYTDEKIGEIGCVAIRQEYQRGGRADALLNHLEENAKAQGLKQVFCLTTNTAHWFLERGFKEAKLSDLPLKKQEMYNYKRGSKPLIKVL